ncbi:MAG: HopJ type III effector protein [Cocleimonas sp.]
MTIENFLEKLKQTPNEMDFNALMELVDKHYDFTETAFDNGDLHNGAGENSGSCKLFSFAKLQGLSEEQTLACFGIYYRDDVLQNPDADNHQNIRNFMKTGWAGVVFSGLALSAKIST